MTPSVDQHAHPTGNSRTADPSNEGVLLDRSVADPDRIGFGGFAGVTDIDVIIPRGTLKAGVRTNGDVPTAGRVARETTAAYCGIPAAGRI